MLFVCVCVCVYRASTHVGRQVVTDKTTKIKDAVSDCLIKCKLDVAVF